jgi:3-mercaptopyruvate sulfurtransferase SseA
MPSSLRTRIVGLVAAVILAGAAVARAAEPLATTPAAPTDAKRIGAAEAKKLVDAGKAIVIDVRGPADYEAEHIAGAISLPNWLVEDRMGELPKDKLIIAYCT